MVWDKTQPTMLPSTGLRPFSDATSFLAETHDFKQKGDYELVDINDIEDWVDEETLRELQDQYEQHEKRTIAILDEVDEVNDGREEDQRNVTVAKLMSLQLRGEIVDFHLRYSDVFAWSYQDMPGLDTDMVVHKLPLKPGCKPVKQKLRRLRPEWMLKIKEEVKKKVECRVPNAL